MDFEVLQPGWVVYVDARDMFYVIGSSEGLKYITNSGNDTEFSSLSTAATSSQVSVDALEPDDAPDHLVQLCWGVQDGMQYKVQVPTGISRLGPDQDITSTYVTVNDSDRWDPNYKLTEMWLVRYKFPGFTVYNATPVSLTPRVWFFGRKYDIRPVTNAGTLQQLRNALAGAGPSPFPFKRITIGGVKRTQ